MTFNDGWGSLPPEANNEELIRGQLMKFNGKTGELTVDGEDADPDAQYVVLGVLQVWTRWRKGKPPLRIYAGLGEPRSSRESLGDTDPRKWELGGWNEKPEDPWKDGRCIWLLRRDTDGLFTLIVETDGGRFAVKKLEDEILVFRCGRPGAIAVIKIGATEYGSAMRPVFEVQDWEASHPMPERFEIMPSLPAALALPAPKEERPRGNMTIIEPVASRVNPVEDDDSPF